MNNVFLRAAKSRNEKSEEKEKLYSPPMTRCSDYLIVIVSSFKMNITFEGKRVLVTGAGQGQNVRFFLTIRNYLIISILFHNFYNNIYNLGIGKEIVKRLVKCKATVIALSKTKKNLDDLAKQVPGIEIVCCDVSDWESTRKAVKSVLPVDHLVNNAAVALLTDFFRITSKELDTTFDINVKSVVNISQVVAANLIERKVGGSIVNVSSQASKAALKDHTAYCASKAAVDALTRFLKSNKFKIH